MKKNIKLKTVRSQALLIIFIIFIIIIILNFRQDKPSSSLPPASQPNAPSLVSTKPDPLEDTIVAADQIIEITFSHPLENVPEFKTRIEPKIDYKVGLSGDKKTAKIIPVTPFELGTTYTLFIAADSKFEGGGRLSQELNFHFRTVRYRGF